MNTTRGDIEHLIAATGKYQLLEENNEGVNAYAFRAYHRPLQQLVFLKILDAGPGEDLFAEPRLLVEATKTGGTESNVVRVHDAEHLGSEYILVAMEFVEGGSILSRLNDGPLPLMDAVTAGVGILHGLAQLHGALLVHRDIKPANVVLTKRHGLIWPLIADFGSVARLAHAEATVPASKHSALYVPPEGWETPSRYDVRSDIYQAGLVLFEMVHGSLPSCDVAYLDRRAQRELKALAAAADGIDAVDRNRVVERALARKASGKGVVSLGDNQPYVPTKLKRIINKAIASDPERRYQKPSDMIGDLEALQLPNWHRSEDGQRYIAHGWSGRDWAVEQDMRNPQQWAISRRRSKAKGFRRWEKAASLREAFRLVT